MSLLTIIQDAADRLQNVQRPAFAAQSADATIRQMVALANDEGQELAASTPWNELTCRVSVPAQDSSVQGEPGGSGSGSGSGASDQGRLEDLAPGCLYLIDDTLWLANQPCKLLGPLSAQQRTALEACQVQGAAWAYWIEGGRLYISRPTSSTQQLTFRYQTRYWVRTADGALSDALRADADAPLLPERCLMLGVVWRWLERNGFPYQQEYMNYTKAVTQCSGRDATRTVLDASGPSFGPSFGPSQGLSGGVMVVN